MKIEKLPRDFVYTDRRTLDDFLRSDDLNKELYKVYLRVKDRPYYVSEDSLRTVPSEFRTIYLTDNDVHRVVDILLHNNIREGRGKIACVRATKGINFFLQIIVG